MVDASTDAFADLVEPHRRELLVHAYRILGSIDDAEDAVQETFIRAWRGRQTFERTISLRAWLYRIATNVCLDARRQRVRRGEPIGPGHGVGPFPDALLEGTTPGPEARYDTHESISLAFLTVLQVLPPRQRAVLVLRDVLGWHAAEVATLLEASVPSVNSALHRARTTVARTYRPVGATPTPNRPPATDPGRLRSLVDRYVQAWEAADITGLVALLRDDAIFSMPPGPSIAGATAIGDLLQSFVFVAGQQIRLLPTRANGAIAFGGYVRTGPDGPFHRYVILVLEEAPGADRIAGLHAYLDAPLGRWFDLPDLIAG